MTGTGAGGTVDQVGEGIGATAVGGVRELEAGVGADGAVGTIGIAAFG